MCGIISGFSKKGKRISKSVFKRYVAQKARGTNGFGYVALYKEGKGNRISVGRSIDEKGIHTQLMNENSSMVSFHHRYPTSTPNIIEATHPIFVSNEELDFDYYIVHNGVIRNSDELKTRHEGYGYVYNTVIDTEVVTQHVSKSSGIKYFVTGTKTTKFNDSESLAIEIARVLDGMSSKIDAVGTVAFVSWKLRKDNGKLVSISYGHNSGNPLTITDNKDHFFLTSVGGQDLPTDILYTLSTDGDSFGTTSQRDLSIGFTTEYYRMNNSNSYSYKFTPLPPTKVGEEVNKKNKNMLEEYEDRQRDKLGYNPDMRTNWDKEEGKVTVVKNKCGYNLDDTLTEFGDIDTTNLDTFQEISSKYVSEYIEHQDNLIDVQKDIDVAETLLKNNNDMTSILILKKDIRESEQKIERLQELMNRVEEKFTVEFPTRGSFIKLVDAYIEQQDENDGILYDIQLEETETSYNEGGKHF